MQPKPFPIYQLMDAFEAFSHGEPDVKPQHRSLYYFLLGYARKRGNLVRYNLPYETGMHGSGIGAWATYDAALRALVQWGFLVYTPGANRFKVPIIELTFLNPTDDLLMIYWQSYSLSTSNSTDDLLATQLATYKDLVTKGQKEIETLGHKLEQDRLDVGAAHAALATAQKKTSELEAELSAALSALPIAPPTGGAACAAHPTNEFYREISKLKIEPLPEQSLAIASRTGGAAILPAVVPPLPKFAIPTESDMLAYMLLQRPDNAPLDVKKVASKCFYYYSANGWKVGKNPMKSWQAACQTFLADVPHGAPAAPAPTFGVSQVSRRQVLSEGLHAQYAELRRIRDQQNTSIND